jgi:multiple sugar transport system ATP-binding protein
MVFQNYALYPHMTVYKNMAFGLKLRKMPKPQIEQRVMEAAKILDITHLLDRKPRQLSGGQRQRVAVGRAIVREPAAFLFDEPLSNLDAKLRVTTRAELKRLHQRLKTTTIYVTHDQEEAMTLGDRIVAMKDGKIQQADTPLRTYSHPVNRFVAGFIGMPPMNFFDGAIKMVDGRMMF